MNSGCQVDLVFKRAIAEINKVEVAFGRNNTEVVFRDDGRKLKNRLIWRGKLSVTPFSLADKRRNDRDTSENRSFVSAFNLRLSYFLCAYQAFLKGVIFLFL